MAIYADGSPMSRVLRSLGGGAILQSVEPGGWRQVGVAGGRTIALSRFLRHVCALSLR